MSQWGVQVTLGDQVLQHIDQGSAGVSTGMKVDHIVGATKLKERLRLWNEAEHRGSIFTQITGEPIKVMKERKYMELCREKGRDGNYVTNIIHQNLILWIILQLQHVTPLLAVMLLKNVLLAFY